MLLDYAARLHPLMIHFPIALLIVAACLDAWELWRPNAAYAGTIRLLVTLGAVGATVAGLTGWLLAAQTRRPPELQTALALHRWLGVAVVIAAGFATVACWRPAPSSGERRLRTVVVVGAALLVVVAGHYGGMLVWGLDYFAP